MLKRKVWIIASMICIGIIGGGVCVHAGRNDIALVKEESREVAGTQDNKIINDTYLDSYSIENLQNDLETYENEKDVSFVGKNIMISDTEIESYILSYENQGMKKAEAQKEAIAYAQKRNALYVAARNAGFDVTDEELWDYLDNLKATLEKDESGIYQAAMEGFESEDAYWKFEYEVYQVNLPIEKYVSYKEKEYAAEHNLEMGTLEFDQQWSEEFERLKMQLVENQNFISVE